MTKTSDIWKNNISENWATEDDHEFWFDTPGQEYTQEDIMSIFRSIVKGLKPIPLHRRIFYWIRRKSKWHRIGWKIFWRQRYWGIWK